MRSDQHSDHTLFIEAIHARRRIRLTFYSKEDDAILVRETAPYDYGPSRRAHDEVERYHFHDFDSDTAPHTLSIVKDQIRSIEPIGKTFDPERLVTWDTRKSPWFVPRDWGRVS